MVADKKSWQADVRMAGRRRAFGRDWAVVDVSLDGESTELVLYAVRSLTRPSAR